MIENEITAIPTRVERGIAWLDEHAEGWRERITINELAMNSPCRCVLGQVFEPEGKLRASTFSAGFWRVVPTKVPGGTVSDVLIAPVTLTPEEAIEHGFDAPHMLREEWEWEYFDALTEAWTEVLA